MNSPLSEVQPFILSNKEEKQDDEKKEQSETREVTAEQIGKVFCFSQSKEYDEDNEDSYYLDNTRKRYAVTDGVSTSFIPASWAEIVAQAFVEHPKDFHADEQFDDHTFKIWLANCSQEWLSWVDSTWLPKNKFEREREGKVPRNWSTQIYQNGAQTTLIGCSLVPLKKPMFRCRVLAVGDAQFFHFRRMEQQKWNLVDSFPYKDSKQFGRHTAVLATRQDLWEIAYKEKMFKTFFVNSGDLIVLTSDALGEWILKYNNQKEKLLTQLLTLRDAGKLKELILKERSNECIKNDDITMMIIPIG